LLDHFLGIETS
jgi:hypothetical protein